MSLTELSLVSELQKSTVSSVLRDSAFWGRVTQTTHGTIPQTYFTYKEVNHPTEDHPINTANIHKVRWTQYVPDGWDTHPELVGQFKLLNILQSND